MDDRDVTMRFVGAIHMVAFGELRLSGHIYVFTKYQARHLVNEYPGLFEIVGGTLEEPPAEKQATDEQATDELSAEEPPAEVEDDPHPDGTVVPADEPATPAPEPAPPDILTVQGADGAVLLRVAEPAPEPNDKGTPEGAPDEPAALDGTPDKPAVPVDEPQPANEPEVKRQPDPVPEKPKPARRAPSKRRATQKAGGSD